MFLITGRKHPLIALSLWFPSCTVAVTGSGVWVWGLGSGVWRLGSWVCWVWVCWVLGRCWVGAGCWVLGAIKKMLFFQFQLVVDTILIPPLKVPFCSCARFHLPPTPRLPHSHAQRHRLLHLLLCECECIVEINYYCWISLLYLSMVIILSEHRSP